MRVFFVLIRVFSEWAQYYSFTIFLQLQYIEPHLYQRTHLSALAVMLCSFSTCLTMSTQQLSDYLQIWHFTVALPTKFGGTRGPMYAQLWNHRLCSDTYSLSMMKTWIFCQRGVETS